MIKSAIFDADGTLLDSMKFWMEVSPRFMKSKGKILSKDMERQLFSMSMEQGAELLKKEFGLVESVEELKTEILKMVGEFYNNEVQLKTGAKELLERFKNQKIPMCVASASDKNLLISAFTRLGIIDFFDNIFTCQELKASKSDPLVYNAASNFMGTKPEETVVFEDTLFAMNTAKKAGYHVIAVEDDYSKKDKEEILKLTDLYVQDFTQVKDL